ncbi:MAG: ABC transporter permease [Firmicutes bacterium]|nr:ABC transporter permease [Bacillota bacterium]
MNILSVGRDFIATTFRLSTPIIFAALGGVISERSGVVNIGLEGMMLLGAFGATVGTYYTHNPFIGLLTGALAGGLAAALHALLSIHFKADQIVSGVAINMLALGATNYLLLLLFQTAGNSPAVLTIPWKIFAASALILPFVLHYFLYRTPVGLRIRAVGEHPKAADTAGINVFFVRYCCVIISGILAGIGGAYLSISLLNRFTRDMSAGTGFIALAAVIFGKWTPIGALGAGLFFGLAYALQFILPGILPHGMKIPPEFFNSLPYLLTMIVLVGAIGKAIPPASDGIPYDPKESR